jgi:Protein of unknown function (DUF742)
MSDVMPGQRVVTAPEDKAGPIVRPYALTGGRTRPQRPYPLEALVVTTFMGEHYAEGGSPEAQAICALCRESRSIAEIAAHLSVPVGVARVLVGDLVREGLVMVHEPSGDAPDTVLLERVLSGLRKL